MGPHPASPVPLREPRKMREIPICVNPPVPGRHAVRRGEHTSSTRRIRASPDCSPAAILDPPSSSENRHLDGPHSLPRSLPHGDMVGAVRAQRIFFWSLLGTLCLHCLPNPDDLEAEYGSGGGGSGGQAPAVDGGTSDGGLAGADGGRG